MTSTANIITETTERNLFASNKKLTPICQNRGLSSLELPPPWPPLSEFRLKTNWSSDKKPPCYTSISYQYFKLYGLFTPKGCVRDKQHLRKVLNLVFRM